MLAWSIETTLMASGLAALAWISGRWLKDSPEARHALWVVVLARFLVPPIFAWPWALRNDQAPHAMTSPAPSIVAPVGSGRSQPPADAVFIGPEAEDGAPTGPDDLVKDDHRDEARSSSIPTDVKSSGFDPELSSSEVDVPDYVQVATDAPSTQAPDVEANLVRVENRPSGQGDSDPAPMPVDVLVGWRGMMMAGWAVGSVVIIGRTMRRIGRFRRAIGRAVEVPPTIRDEVIEVALRFGVNPPRALVGRGLPAPSLWCLGPARLILPEGIESMSKESRSAVIGHEMAHLARSDQWVARMELIAGAIWWWNPLFHLARRRVRDEAELACDARVVRACPESRFAYAEALVLACERHAQPALTLPALGIGGRSVARNFETRLDMILRAPIRTPGRWPSIVAAAMLALAIPSWTEGKQAPEPVQTPKPGQAAVQPAGPAQGPVSSTGASAAQEGTASRPTYTATRKLLAAGVDLPKVENLESITPRKIAEEVEKRQGPAESLEFRVAVTMTSQEGPVRQERIKVGDFTLGRPVGTQQLGDFTRFEILESAGSPTTSGPTRRFFATNAQTALSLHAALSWSGPVPVRWLGGSEARETRRDNLVARILGPPSFLWPADGGDRSGIGVSPESLLGLAGMDRMVLNPQLVQMRLAGTESIDGVDVVRIAWKNNDSRGPYLPETHGLCWVAPSLDFAVVRLEAAGPDVASTPPARLTWRKESWGYRKVEGCWLPTIVEYSSAGSSKDASTRIVATFENFQVDRDLDDDTFHPNLMLGKLDPRSGDFTTTPPAVAPDLVEAFSNLAATLPLVLAPEVLNPAPPATDSPAANRENVRARATEDTDPRVSALRARIDEAARRLGRVRSASTDQADPAIRRAEEQLNAAVAELADYLKRDPRSEQDDAIKRAIEARDRATIEVNRKSALARNKLISEAEAAFAKAQLAKAQAEVVRELAGQAASGKGNDVSRADAADEASNPAIKSKADRHSGLRGVQQAELARAEVVRDRARITFDRQKNLSSRGATSQEDLDKAEGDLKLAEAGVEVERAKLAAIDDQPENSAGSTGVRSGDRSSVQKAELARAEAVRDRIKGEYARTKKLVDGRVLSKNDLDDVEAKLKVAEAEVAIERAKLAAVESSSDAGAPPDPATASTLAAVATSLGRYEDLADQVSARFADLTKARATLKQQNSRLLEINDKLAQGQQISDVDRKEAEAARETAHGEVMQKEAAFESLVRQFAGARGDRGGEIDRLKADSKAKAAQDDDSGSAIGSPPRASEKSGDVKDRPDKQSHPSAKPDESS